MVLKKTFEIIVGNKITKNKENIGGLINRIEHNIIKDGDYLEEREGIFVKLTERIDLEKSFKEFFDCDYKIV